MDLVCHTIFYSASDRVSFLHFLRTVGQVGGAVQTYESLVARERESSSTMNSNNVVLTNQNTMYDRLIDRATGGLAEQLYIRNGATQLLQRMANELGTARVRLNSAVMRIEQPNDYETEDLSSTFDQYPVTVETLDNVRLRCKFVVLTVPPPLAARIHTEPPMPASRDILCQSMVCGAAIKTITVYSEPFWREGSASGSFLSSNTDVRWAFDASETLDSGECVYALAGLFIGNGALHWSEYTSEERRQAVCSAYARVFGDERANTPLAYFEHDWSVDGWSRGGLVASAMPGTLTTVGEALFRPIGRLHFAGPETAIASYNYFEGPS